MRMSPREKGIGYALLAALSFGASVPLLKRLGVDAAPVTLAGLLYGGAAVALFLVQLLYASKEASIPRADAPTLAGVAIAGAVAGPILLLFGLRQASGVAASLLLNLEPALTVALAVTFFREQASGKAAAGIGLLIAAGAMLGLRGLEGGTNVAGFLLLAGACLCWAMDNNLTQRLSLLDPIAVARWKAALGATCTLLLGRVLGEPWPAERIVVSAAAVGAVSYGLSVALAVRSLREIGAARYAALFSAAPFSGALLSTVLLGEHLHSLDLAAAAVMVAGLWLVAKDRHEHLHGHETVEHEHLHVHDEHHQHVHAEPVEEPHSHRHRHGPMTHAHPHTPDSHHHHKHGD